MVYFQNSNLDSLKPKLLTKNSIDAIIGTMTRNASVVIDDKLVCISVTILTPDDGIGIPADTPFFKIKGKRIHLVCPVLTGGLQNAYVFSAISDTNDTLYHIRPGITPNTEIFMNFVGWVFN